MIHHLSALSLALAQASAPVFAPPPAQPCFSRQDIGAVVVTLLPVLVDTLSERCRTHLAGDAFLNVGAADMSARLRAAAEPRRESAMRALAQGTVINGVAVRSGPEAVERITALVTRGFNRVNARSCADIDTLLSGFSQLQPETIADMVGAMAGLAGPRAPICREPVDLERDDDE